MKPETITVKLQRQKQRVAFLFHDGQFKAKREESRKAYNRKKLAKPVLDSEWF